MGEQNKTLEQAIRDRPLPQPDDATAEFWAACRRHELRVQKCAACDHVRWPARPMCPRCQTFECEWVRVSGRGTIYSYVVAHPPVLPVFAEKAPFPIVLVALEDHPTVRMIGNLIAPAGEALKIGAHVEVAFEDVGSEVTLPQWKVIA